jgi:hypothetical protein
MDPYTDDNKQINQEKNKEWIICLLITDGGRKKLVTIKRGSMEPTPKQFYEGRPQETEDTYSSYREYETRPVLWIRF